MADRSAIEWTDSTFNPWTGCTKVSPGCDHCYAEARMDTRLKVVSWGAGQPRKRTKTWGDPVRWNARHEAFYAAHGRRQRVFCASLADVFDNEVDPVWRADLFALIAKTPNLDWLLLTKRIGNAERMIEQALIAQGDGATDAWGSWPWPHVWLGATVVDQAEADRDIPKLLATPAAVRFLSMEPLLGPVTLNPWLLSEHGRRQIGARAGIGWVIAGGESGHHARPMHPDWARRLRDQCAAAGVPFLFKQWGEWTPGENVERQRGVIPIASLWDNTWQISNLDLYHDHGHIDDQPDLYRVGKKAAGRHLDGEVWDGVPS